MSKQKSAGNTAAVVVMVALFAVIGIMLAATAWIWSVS